MFGKRGKKVSVIDFTKSMKKEEKKVEGSLASMLVLTYNDNKGNTVQAKTYEEINKLNTIKSQVKFMIRNIDEALFFNVKKAITAISLRQNKFRPELPTQMEEEVKGVFAMSSKEYTEMLRKNSNDKCIA